jgi:hypothetical protein
MARRGSRFAKAPDDADDPEGAHKLLQASSNGAKKLCIAYSLRCLAHRAMILLMCALTTRFIGR